MIAAMSKKEKRILWRIFAAGILFMIILPVHYREGAYELFQLAVFQAPVLAYLDIWILPLSLAAYLIIGWDVVWKAVRNISRGQVFDENFLMTVATVGAFCLADYEEAVAVMLFFQVGELFQSYAVSKSRRSIADLMDIRPDYANVMRDSSLVRVDPEEVMVGEIIVVKPGERVPLDGVVEDGYSLLDTAALTGESAPREVTAGETVISGCINQTGRLTLRVSKEFGQSTVSKILELVENASDKKSKSENFITRFARYYTPLVVAAAVVLAILPPVVTGQEFSIWIHRALTFLVISCPCALVISVPLSFFGGIGGASKSGVLVKGSNYLEALANTEIVVFDKTGTLTKGNFAVSKVYSDKMSGQELLKWAAYAENDSGHPIAVSIKKAYGKMIDPSQIKDTQEIAGHGVRALVQGREVLAGGGKMMDAQHIAVLDTAPAGTVVHLAIDGEYAGYIQIEDEIKQDSPQAILDLKTAGIKQIVMLTGDSDAVGQKVAAELKLDKAYTELLPAGKVAKMEEIMGAKSAKGMLVFVGDGINDAPVLARADIGIAMGALGSDAAIEAADVVIMTDEPSKVAAAIKISQKTLRIVRQNIVFALGTKGIVLILGALGYASMWAAVFADVGVAFIAILNAIRALDVQEFNRPVLVSAETESKISCAQAAP